MTCKCGIKRFTAVIAVALALVLGSATTLVGCSVVDEPKTPDVYYTVLFESNGGSAVRKQSVKAGGKALRPTNPKRDGYSFIDWYSDEGLKHAYGFETTPVNADITLYALWGDVDVTYYTVTFETNGGSAVDSKRVAAGESVDQPPAPKKDGDIFVGWYSDSALNNVYNFSDAITCNRTIYAKWKNGNGGGQSGGENTGVYTITLDANGGTLGAVSSMYTANGMLATLPDAPTAPDGKTFAGWFTSATDGARVTTGTQFTQDCTIYAQWDDVGGGGDLPIGTNDVTATFNVGLDARKAGLSNPPAQVVKSNSRLIAPDVTRSGYTLSGWYVENGNTKWSFDSDRLSENTTLFAKWTAGGGNAVSYTPSMTANNTLYIHYQRLNGDYDRWSLWVWGTGNGTKVSSSTKDASGAVYAISMSSYGQSVNFKPAVINGTTWELEDGGDCSVRLSDTLKVGGSYHWFINENDTANGKPYLTSVLPSGLQTEAPRASATNVIRSNAASLPVASTATTCDEMGVGYQIFVASFCDSDGDGTGDLRGIINKLDYLKGLSVDVLWLTPVQSSNSVHGYDCYDYYAIDPKFGTNADYRELVYKAHLNGMKVIMDLVVNHTSPQNEWFVKSKQGVIETVTYQDGTTAQVKYRDFYRWKQTSSGDRWRSSGDGWYFYSSFGGGMPELNYDCQSVRNAMSDVAAYWMNFGLDGFRMDAIKHIFMNDESENAPSDHIVGDSGWQYNLEKNVEFFKEFNYKLKSKYPYCFLLGEQLDGNPANVAPFYKGMDSLFDFNTFFDLPGKITGGYPSTAANSFNSNASLYASNRGGRAINSMISSNHDLDRLQSKLGDVAHRKLYFAVIMTMPGLSWIYYGDEIGLVGYEVNPYGDDGRRQSMKWTSGWQYKCTAVRDLNLNAATASVAEQESDGSSLLSYVKSLAKLRNDNPVLINGTATCSVDNGMLKITVTDGTKTVVAYHNFSSGSKTVNTSATPIFGSKTVGAYGTAVFGG